MMYDKRPGESSIRTMSFDKAYSDLSPQESRRAKEALRRLFQPIVISVEECEGETQWGIQLETRQVQVHRIFKHRLLTASYRAEARIDGKILWLHRIAFHRPGGLPEPGMFEILTLHDCELWSIASRIKNGSNQECQVLIATPEVEQVLRMPEFKPYLPQRLQGLDLEAIRLKQEPERLPPANVPTTSVDGEGELVDQQA